MSNRAKYGSVRDLEHPLLKVPFEQLNLTFRSSQKAVDKDLSVVQRAVKDLSKKKPKEAGELIGKVVSRLRGVKRKLEETNAEEVKQLSIIRCRIDHLDSASEGQGEKRYSHVRLNRILVDYMLREGYYDSANKMAETTNIQNLVDVEVFIKSKNVLDGLRGHTCTAALQWCVDNKSKLKKSNSTLEFQLRLQEFLELVRSQKKHEAIDYARKYLTAKKPEEERNEAIDASNMALVQRSMAALAFGPGTSLSPYRELFQDERWAELEEMFKKDFYLLYSLTTKPLLTITLQAGLSALKTPLAYQEDHYNVNDPLCDKTFQDISNDLPYATHNHSKLVCRISNQVMDDRNPAMVLPNGNVYSMKGLESICVDNKVTDPRTKETFAWSGLRKSFIMN
ncbi:hypothetical protein AKO1_015579 [Acrasis kona]|uniref:Macrophage erythroblast attacher n=1 Tax=Acrasis kona TaxID=1008807 RepID=A0AAW2ZGC1_9EUKA